MPLIIPSFDTKLRKKFQLLITIKITNTINRNHNRNRDTSIAPTKAKLRKPAYSQALYIKSNRCARVKSQRGQAGRLLRRVECRVETMKKWRRTGEIRIRFMPAKDRRSYKMG